MHSAGSAAEKNQKPETIGERGYSACVSAQLLHRVDPINSCSLPGAIPKALILASWRESLFEFSAMVCRRLLILSLFSVTMISVMIRKLALE
jgi:hypothetical protein